MYTNSLNTGTVYPPPAGTLHKVYIRILYTEHQLLQELYTEVAWTGKATLAVFVDIITVANGCQESVEWNCGMQ